jgi:hypothetical protein
MSRRFLSDRPIGSKKMVLSMIVGLIMLIKTLKRYLEAVLNLVLYDKTNLNSFL